MAHHQYGKVLLLCVSSLSWSSLPSLAVTYRQVDVPGSDYTVIFGINSAGQMVGQYRTENGSSGFVYSDGLFKNINYPGTTSNTATAINDHGDIVGNYYTGVAGYGFLYHNGQFTTITYPGATATQVNGINNLGDIVGGYVDQASTWHGFLLRQATFTSLEVPGADFISAYGINDQEIVSGYFHTYCDNNCDLVEGFLFYGGQVHTGAPNTVFYGINNLNEVVGNCNDSRGEAVIGCLSSQHQSLYWNYPGMYLTTPYAINNKGIVVGEIVDYSNLTHGFVAQP